MDGKGEVNVGLYGGLGWIRRGGRLGREVWLERFGCLWLYRGGWWVFRGREVAGEMVGYLRMFSGEGSLHFGIEGLGRMRRRNAVVMGDGGNGEHE